MPGTEPLYAEVLRYLGVRDDADEELETRIDAEISRCRSVMQPSYLYRIFDTETTASGIRLTGTALLLCGNDMLEQLGRAHKCAVMAATLGMETERELVRLSRTDTAKAVIFDAVCTALIEETADCCETEIQTYVDENGYRTGFRFSPGYGDFQLSVQKTLLETIDAPRRLGIRLTESDLMIPTKSVTAVIGIFPKTN